MPRSQQKNVKKATATRAPNNAASPVQQPLRITVHGKGLVRQKWLRGALVVDVYTSQAAAVEAGIPEELAANVFRLSTACGGGCGTTHETVRGVKYVYCEDTSCESQGSCSCHVIRHFEKPPKSGQWHTEDMDKHYGSKHHLEEDGTSTYICDCYPDDSV